jgi:hypothetical protein
MERVRLVVLSMQRGVQCSCAVVGIVVVVPHDLVNERTQQSQTTFVSLYHPCFKTLQN